MLQKLQLAHFTKEQRMRLDRLTSRVTAASSDSNRENRLKRLQCKHCYYIDDSYCCQNGHEFDCQICGKFTRLETRLFQYRRLCDTCAKDNFLCINCAADIDLTETRQTWLKEETKEAK